MARSISFTIEGEVDTLVTVTELADGTLRFDLSVTSSTIGDLRAVFFDLQDFVADDSLYVTDAAEVTDTAFAEEGVDTLGKDANIKGAVSNELGDFDVGIEFGTSGASADDIQSASFVLGSNETALTLDMLNLSDFGIRYTSVGTADGDRSGSAKIGDQAGAVASDDALLVLEDGAASVSLLANDGAPAGTLVQSAVTAGGLAFSADAAGLTAAIVIAGKSYGTASLSADGTLSVVADGPDADSLSAGASVAFAFTYTTVAPDGTLATADAVVTISGTNDAPEAAADMLATDADAQVAFAAGDLLSNDTDPDLASGVLTIVSVDTTNTLGIVVDNGDGTYSYDPAGAFDGLAEGETATDSFSYTIRDPEGSESTATVTVTVTGVAGGPPLFTDGADVIDFATVVAGSYAAGTQYAGLDGNDIVTLAQDAAAAAAAGYDPLLTFDAGAGNDRVNGGSLDDRIEGGAGDDVLRAYGGDDILSGGDGNDRLIGEGGNDILIGGAGNDWLQIGSGDDVADGGDGVDILDFIGATVGVIVDVAAGTATGDGNDTFSNVETFYGSQFGDVFEGGDAGNVYDGRQGDDVIRAGGGNDNIQGSEGDDEIYGEDGNDFIVGGPGADLLDGGDGIDTLSFSAYTPVGGTHVDLGLGIAVTEGETDTVLNFENVTGSRSGDTLIGDAGDNILNGLGGDDVLTGGAGADIFFYFPTRAEGNDTITDFTAGEDFIRLFAYSGGFAGLTLTDTGGDVVIDWGIGTTITVLDATIQEVTDGLVF